MNIFDWGGTAGRVNEARAGFAQASRARDMFEEAVKLEVKQSYLARDESLQALVIAEDGLAQAEEAMRVAREAFRNGFATSSDVLDAQAALAGAEMNRVQAAAGLRLAEERLVLATGGTN
jgi:outer membrane protein TolC